MPIYRYSCPSCGLSFKKMQSVSSTGTDCKRCGKAATKQVSAGTFKFAHHPGAPAPTNTGASSVDHDVDVVIGRDSQLRLGEMVKRQDYKRSVMRSNNLETGERLSRLDDGDYFVMTPEEQAAAKHARHLNHEAMKLIEGYKATRPISEEKKAAERAQFLGSAS